MFLTIKNIPKNYWSSKKPLNLKPKSLTVFYLIANLGPGPRDGLMTGIQRITNFPIAAVRAGIEITVVSIGWYLGGTVGVGTLLFAFGIGPAVALGLYLVGKFFN